MNCKQCEKCKAKWLQLEEGGDYQHYWATGRVGSELDLAGLVCNNLSDADASMCINPLRGAEGGDTWKKRLDFITSKTDEHFK